MGVNTSGGHPSMDYAEHVRTYNGFITWARITVISSIAVLVGMALFLL